MQQTTQTTHALYNVIVLLFEEVDFRKRIAVKINNKIDIHYKIKNPK